MKGNLRRGRSRATLRHASCDSALKKEVKERASERVSHPRRIAGFPRSKAGCWKEWNRPQDPTGSTHVTPHNNVTFANRQPAQHNFTFRIVTQSRHAYHAYIYNTFWEPQMENFPSIARLPDVVSQVFVRYVWRLYLY